MFFDLLLFSMLTSLFGVLYHMRIHHPTYYTIRRSGRGQNKNAWAFFPLAYTPQKVTNLICSLIYFCPLYAHNINSQINQKIVHKSFTISSFNLELIPFKLTRSLKSNQIKSTQTQLKLNSNSNQTKSN